MSGAGSRSRGEFAMRLRHGSADVGSGALVICAPLRGHLGSMRSRKLSSKGTPWKRNGAWCAGVADSYSCSVWRSRESLVRTGMATIMTATMTETATITATTTATTCAAGTTITIMTITFRRDWRSAISCLRGSNVSYGYGELCPPACASGCCRVRKKWSTACRRLLRVALTW